MQTKLPSSGDQQSEDTGGTDEQSEQENTGTGEHQQEQQLEDNGEHRETVDDSADTFPRSYVERLREESSGYRTERNEATERVATMTAVVWNQQLQLDGRLADVTDISMPDNFDGDPETVTAAVTALLEAKPHLAARRATGDIGQHSGSDSGGEEFSIFGAMRGNA